MQSRYPDTSPATATQRLATILIGRDVRQFIADKREADDRGATSLATSTTRRTARWTSPTRRRQWHGRRGMSRHLLVFAAGVGVDQSPAASQVGEARGAAESRKEPPHDHRLGLTTIPPGWVLIGGGLMFASRARRGLVLLARTADGGRVVTAWAHAVRGRQGLSGDQFYDFVTAFILSWLAGAIDEVIRRRGDEAMRCWGVRSRADLDLLSAFVVGMLLGAVLLVLLLSLVGRSGQAGDVGLSWGDDGADPSPSSP